MMKTITVKDLGEVITGNTPPRSKPELYGDYTPFIKATDISETSKYTYEPEECYSEEGYKKYRNSLIPRGATCVVTIGSVGKKMTMAHCDCFINQAMNAIIPNENYDNEYVYYLLKHNVHKLKMLNSGTASGRENVSKSAFSNMELLAVQDVAVQKKIGSVLASFDRLIENNLKQIKLLEEAAQRLYKEWFVDLRFPGYEETEIVDGVPANWEKATLNDICELRKEIVVGSKIEGGIPYIGLEHMPRKDFCLAEWGDSSEVNSNKYQCYEDDVMFGKIRPYFHKVGFVIKNCISSTDAIIMVAKEGLWGLLLMVASSNAFVEYTYKTCKEGAKMPRADWDEMRKYSIVVAPENIQKQFEGYIWDITRKVKILALQNRNLVEIRDRLLPKLMSGEIEV